MQTLKTVFQFFQFLDQKSRTKATGLVILNAASGILEFVSLGFIYVSINLFFFPKKPQQGLISQFISLLGLDQKTLLAAAICVFVGGGILSLFSIHQTYTAAFKAGHYLSIKLLKSIICTNALDLKNRNTSEIIKIVLEDVNLRIVIAFSTRQLQEPVNLLELLPH